MVLTDAIPQTPPVSVVGPPVRKMRIGHAIVRPSVQRRLQFGHPGLRPAPGARPEAVPRQRTGN
jgi:hypothetical protein